MSSSDRQTPFIGSKISLISKMDIRYEGVLYNVDPIESTIALVKVRSFGTEERPAQCKVSAHDTVYDCITFRAADIKDLVICEVPNQPPMPPPLQVIEEDPAIISVSTHSNVPQNYENGFSQQSQFYGVQQPRGYIAFNDDYDFERANMQFQQSLNGIDAGVQNVTIQDTYTEGNSTESSRNERLYDRNRSFFDEPKLWSTGTVPRTNGRHDHFTNQETFGQSTVRSQRYVRGSRGRGAPGYRTRPKRFVPSNSWTSPNPYTMYRDMSEF
ncbi:scd6-like sm domain-containing protein [Ditylenchus destructor]|nr:scd6-like sm domain-containing protein [Ditylenchus destructor]